MANSPSNRNKTSGVSQHSLSLANLRSNMDNNLTANMFVPTRDLLLAFCVPFPKMMQSKPLKQMCYTERALT